MGQNPWGTAPVWSDPARPQHAALRSGTAGLRIVEEAEAAKELPAGCDVQHGCAEAGCSKRDLRTCLVPWLRGPLVFGIVRF